MTQQDYIDGMVDMRKAFDGYSKNLTTYPTTEIDDPEEDLYKVRTAFAYTAFYVYYD